MTDLRPYALGNQDVIAFVRHATPGVIDRYVGTLDYATARFNTILLWLSQKPLQADQHREDIEQCYQAIQKFYRYTKHYLTWPYWLKPVAAIVLHWIGKTEIPKIKKLLDTLDN